MSEMPTVAYFLLPQRKTAYLLFFICCASAIFYVLQTGLIGIWPDLTGYAAQTRSLLETGSLTGGIAAGAGILPLYSLLLIPAFALPDILAGHWIVIAIQILFLVSCFFPLRALLLRRTGLSEIAASSFAVLTVLSPFILPFAAMLTPQGLFTALLIWFAAFFDRFLEKPERRIGWVCAVLLGLMLLTQQAGWIAWMAALLSILIGKKARRDALRIILFPLGLWALWAIYAAATWQEAATPLSFFGNNALARFNLIKNGIVYVLYAGLPLAGLAFLLCLPGKLKEGRDPFFLFGFFCVALAVVLAGFSTPIVVEKKLDFVFNRALEPFLFLTAVNFFRLEEGARKQLLGNGMLVVFVLLFFGLPFTLEPDFVSGLGYWANSLSNRNLGHLRNILYLVLVAAPVLLLFLRPKWFLPSILMVAAIFSLAGLMQAGTYWAYNEDNNFRFIAVRQIAANAELHQAKAVYADFRCKTPSDISSVYRCFDLAKLLYFMPGRAQNARVAELPEKVGEEGYVLYSSSENDTLLGPVMAQLGLARMMKVSAASLKDVEDTPRVHIKKIDGMTRYVFMPVGGKLQRMAMLEQKASLTLTSDRTGCAELGMLLIMNNEAGDRLKFDLNGQKETRFVSSAKMAKGLQTVFVKFNVPEGKSEIKLSYGAVQKAGEFGETYPELLMFERPIFRSCREVRWN